jgi:hypothetical protein
LGVASTVVRGSVFTRHGISAISFLAEDGFTCWKNLTGISVRSLSFEISYVSRNVACQYSKLSKTIHMFGTMDIISSHEGRGWFWKRKQIRCMVVERSYKNQNPKAGFFDEASQVYALAHNEHLWQDSSSCASSTRITNGVVKTHHSQYGLESACFLFLDRSMLCPKRLGGSRAFGLPFPLSRAQHAREPSFPVRYCI